MTAALELFGFEGRGAGIKIRDNATNAENSGTDASDREWFIGSPYSPASAFNIGYAANGVQSEYAAQSKLTILNSGNVGVATTTPLAKFHVQNTALSTDYTASDYASAIIEAVDSQLELVSNHSGTWGSTLLLKEQNVVSGDNNDTVNVWAISRQTTEGDGDGSLRFNYGPGNNHNTGSPQVTFTNNGEIAVGTVKPVTPLHLKKSGTDIVDVLTIETSRSDVGNDLTGGAIKFVNSDDNSAGMARIKVASAHSATPIGYSSEPSSSFIFETALAQNVAITSVDGDATTITVVHATHTFEVGQKIAIHSGAYSGSYYIDTVDSDTQFTIADTDHDLDQYTGNAVINYGKPSDSMIIRADGRVGIKTNTPKATLHVEQFGLETTSTSVSSTNATVIDSFAHADFRTVKYLVQITQGTKYQSSELMSIHDGTTAIATEYAMLETDGILGTLAVDVNGDNVELKVTMAAATAATVKVVRQCIEV